MGIKVGAMEREECSNTMAEVAKRLNEKPTSFIFAGIYDHDLGQEARIVVHLEDRDQAHRLLTTIFADMVSTHGRVAVNLILKSLENGVTIATKGTMDKLMGGLHE